MQQNNIVLVWRRIQRKMIDCKQHWGLFCWGTKSVAQKVMQKQCNADIMTKFLEIKIMVKKLVESKGFTIISDTVYLQVEKSRFKYMLVNGGWFNIYCIICFRLVLGALSYYKALSWFYHFLALIWYECLIEI